eukprot:gene41586-21162_t
MCKGVLFKEHASAAKAVEGAHGTVDAVASEEGNKMVAPKKTLYVCRHQKKSEREHVRRQKQRLRAAKYRKGWKREQGFTNLYIKNLADTVSSPKLREAFSEFGE